MSEKEQPDTSPAAGEPRPESLRFFGTTWAERSGGYWPRRLGVAVGSLALAVGGAYVLKLAYEGLDLADTGGFVRTLLVLCFAVCSAVGFSRTLGGFQRRREDGDPSVERSMRSILVVGFVGVLFAYFVRSLVEAPGEKLLREDYEQQREQYERRRSTRTRNPAKRKRKKG